MTNPSVHISLTSPCHEDLSGMTITERGRFCSACQKDVINFSALSDDEVLTILSSLKGQASCGMFSVGQLNRPVERRGRGMPVTRLFRSKLAAATILFQSLVVTATAHARNSIKTEQAPIAPVSKDSMLVVTGKVLDAYTQTPVEGVQLSISCDTAKVVTDADGQFTFKVKQPFTATAFSIYPSKENMDDTFVLEQVQVDVADYLQGKEIILYRYMGGVINHTVKAYKKPLVDNYFVGGFTTVVTGPNSALYSSHPLIINMWKVWDFFAKPFKRKKHHEHK
jgi:hypothetical protein